MDRNLLSGLMDQDLLSVLEGRVQALADKLQALRADNERLRADLQERDDRLAKLEGDMTHHRELVALMEQEKESTVARIEGLLQRFEGMDL